MLRVEYETPIAIIRSSTLVLRQRPRIHLNISAPENVGAGPRAGDCCVMPSMPELDDIPNAPDEWGGPGIQFWPTF